MDFEREEWLAIVVHSVAIDWTIEMLDGDRKSFRAIRCHGEVGPHGKFEKRFVEVNFTDIEDSVVEVSMKSDPQKHIGLGVWRLLDLPEETAPVDCKGLWFAGRVYLQTEEFDAIQQILADFYLKTDRKLHLNVTILNLFEDRKYNKRDPALICKSASFSALS